MLDVDPHRSRRPRPVADVPLAGLASGIELTRAWMLHLIAGAPLDRVAHIDLGALAQQGPALCAAVIRALAADDELARLEPGGDLGAAAARAGRLAGAGSEPAPAAAAVEALRAACWHELRAALDRPPAELVGDLAERLAHVCAVVTQAVLAGAPTPTGPQPLEPGEEGEGTVRAWRTGATDGAGGLDGWPAGIARALGASSPTVAVLAVDVDEADRLLAADQDGEVARGLQRVERVLAAVLDPDQDVLAIAPGRYGVTAPGTGGAAARALGERLAAAVAVAAAPRGVPLRASVGLATSPEDGEDPATLSACAEERAVTARATGVTLA